MTHRSALALRRPRSLFDGQPEWPKNSPVLLDWMDAHWEALRERSPNDMLCLVVDAALAVLEPLALDGDKGAKSRVRDWSHCIWADQYQEGCPKPLYLPARLRLMRLNQGMRAWQATSTGSPFTSTWVDRLSLLWGIAVEECWNRFQWLMKSDFPFSGNVLEDPFMAYLRNPGDPGAIDRLGLRPLAKWTPDRGWFQEDVKRLHELFPGNECWKGWIDQFQTLLKEVRDQRLRIPHHAWREDKALGELRDHLTAIADEQLTASHGLSLAGLFWNRQAGRWLQAIAQRQNDLHDLTVQDEPNHYLEVTPRYHWVNRRTVGVNLHLEFRGTRVLLVKRAYLPNGGLIPSSPVNTPIPGDGAMHEYAFTLAATGDDELDLWVTLDCLDFRGICFQRPVHLMDKRGLEGFRSEAAWQTQARALMGWLAARVPLFWLRGPDWPQDEHERLEALVQDRYPEGWRAARRVLRLDAIGSGPEPVFVAGFSVQAGQEVVEATHALLHQHNRGALERWALALWLEARAGQDGDPIREALTKLLPAREVVISVGPRLLGEEGWDALMEGLERLPAQSAVAWACGGALDDESPPRIGDLGLGAWQALLKPDLADSVMANWLDVAPPRVGQMRQLAQKTQALIAGVQSGGLNVTTLVQPLAAALWPDALMGIHKKAPFVNSPVELMYRRLPRAYLLPPGIGPTRGLAREDEGLWLLIGRAAPPGLPGVSLGLDADAVLALLASEDAKAAQRRLNEIAGGQWSPEPGRVFQIAGGIDEERMANAFHGRERERQDHLAGPAAL